VVICGHYCADFCDKSHFKNRVVASNLHARLDLEISITSLQGGPDLAMASLSCRASGGLMIQPLRHLNGSASDSHLGIALVVAAVVLGLMLWGILWQANIIAYQRELIRLLSAAQSGGMG
jgi:hypothetical protein